MHVGPDEVDALAHIPPPLLFPAPRMPAGRPLLGADDEKPLIGAQAQRWRFSFPAATDREQHDAVRAAAAFLGSHRESLPDVPTSVTGVAVLAVDLHDVFLGHDGASRAEPAVAAALSSRRRVR